MTDQKKKKQKLPEHVVKASGAKLHLIAAEFGTDISAIPDEYVFPIRDAEGDVTGLARNERRLILLDGTKVTNKSLNTALDAALKSDDEDVVAETRDALDAAVLKRNESSKKKGEPKEPPK